MGTVFRRGGRPVAAVAAVFFLAGAYSAGEPGDTEGHKPTALDKEINASLRDVINRGADLFNGGDRMGCVRVYEGALLAVKPVLAKHHPTLGKAIDKGLAEVTVPGGSAAARAFALRAVLDRVREHLVPAKVADKKGPGTGTKKGPPEEKKAPPEEKKAPPDEARTLWQRLGGEEGVRKVVDDFVRAAAADKQVDFSRGGKHKIDKAKLKDGLVDWVSQQTDGPLKYTGPNMKELHKGMHITDREFDLIVDHVRKALKDNGANPAAAAELLSRVKATRKDIVAPADGKQPAGKKTEEKQPAGGKAEEKKGGEPKGGNPKGTAPDKGAKQASVSGRVIYKGNPLPSGGVTLVAAGGKKYSGALQGDGTYEVKGLPPGEYAVAVHNASVKSSITPIPARYFDAQTSGLRVTLTKGANNFDIELK
jgi:hemoglobin